MANLRIKESVRNTMLDIISTAIDVDAGAGSIKIYEAPQPANADTGLSGQKLLATIPFADPCVAAGAGSGTLTFDCTPAIEDASADDTGTAAWARIADNSGDTVFDCDVTATGGGGTIQLNTTSIVTGGPVRITSFTISIPAA